MKTEKIILFATILTGTAVVGCAKETTPSSNIRTEGIAALITVTAKSESASTVRAELRVGGSSSNTYVILENGDQLTAKAGDESKAMHAEEEGVYEAEFSTGADGTEFSVLFERAEDADALSNRGTLPAPFTIGALPTTSPSRATEDLTVTWDPPAAGGDMEIKVEGDCIYSKTIDVPGDSGSYVITKGTIESTGVKDTDKKACDLDVTLTRSRSGTADSVFDKESSFKLYQVRKASFTSAP